MLTQKDLDEIKQLIDEEFEKRLKFLPTKDVLYEKLDGIMDELQAMRQEMTLANDRLSKHSDQLGSSNPPPCNFINFSKCPSINSG